jgi:hypothetical protein
LGSVDDERLTEVGNSRATSSIDQNIGLVESEYVKTEVSRN